MEHAQRESLSQQADDLVAALDASAAVTKDAVSLLTRLNKHLAKLNKVNAPILNQAERLTWAEQNIAAAKVATDQLAVHLATARKVEPALRQGPGRDLSSYLTLLHQLEASMAALEAQYTLHVAQEAYTHAAKIHRKALEDCEADFVLVLSQQTSAAMPSASALTQAAEGEAMQAAVFSPTLPEFNTKALARLKSLAQLLRADPQSNAFTAYAQVRGKALMAVLQGAAGPSTPASAQGLEQAEKAAASWILQLRMLTVMCATEVALCEAVWGEVEDMPVVGEVVQQPLDTLAQQGKDMSKGRAQPFRVFVLLDMLGHVEEVLPLLEGLLGGHAGTDELLEPLREVSLALATAARELFAAFESGIAKDASKAQMVDGTVHPLTASTLGYLRRLFTYGETTQVLFVDRGRGGMGALSQQVAARRMSEAVYQCMGDLLTALEAKARAYKSRALASVFLMNNVHYMVATAEQSESLAVLGKSWVEKHKDIIEQYGQEYHELVWMPLVRQLQAVQSGEDPEPADVAKWKDWVKRHFRAVNKVLEKSCTEQSAWSIPDPRLRLAVCRVILQDLMPPYQHFWDTYSHTDFTSTRSKYVRCSPDDLERMVTNDLFQGHPVNITWGRKPGTPEKLVPMPTLSEPSSASLPASAPMPRTSRSPRPGPSGLARSVR